MTELLIFALIGFIAQLVNGALGMGYGMISMSALLLLGVPPLVANAAVQFSKMLASGISGVSHWKYKNVDSRLTQQLTGAGILGALIGAFLVSSLPEHILIPVLAVYLFLIGVQIWFRVRRDIRLLGDQSVMILGGVGGFLNAIGGAGWGPVVTSTLIARGHNPRLTIGSVSVSEFFVTMAILAVLSPQLRGEAVSWHVIFGLMSGGVVAAPLAAYLCGKLPTAMLARLVGVLVMVLSITIFVSGL